MKRSVEHILTTHTGSLPRPSQLVEVMFAKEEGRNVDPQLMDQRVRDAVKEVVRHQHECGIAVVSGSATLTDTPIAAVGVGEPLPGPRGERWRDE